VHGGYWDLRAGRLVADLDLDDAWTGLHMSDGGSTHTLSAPDGRTVSLWADEQFGYLQVFTTRRYPAGDGFSTAIAVEPMTAPADALNSGAGLRWLEPGQDWSASWSIRYRGAAQ
jgi:aldose 1-epimerase